MSSLKYHTRLDRRPDVDFEPKVMQNQYSHRKCLTWEWWAESPCVSPADTRATIFELCRQPPAAGTKGHLLCKHIWPTASWQSGAGVCVLWTCPLISSPLRSLSSSPLCDPVVPHGGRGAEGQGPQRCLAVAAPSPLLTSLLFFCPLLSSLLPSSPLLSCPLLSSPPLFFISPALWSYLQLSNHCTHQRAWKTPE